MDSLVSQFQRRAILGNRHFILADPEVADLWALPGSVVLAVDENGIRCFGPARTISTQALRGLAKAHKLPFKIEEQFPLVHRDFGDRLAA